MKCVKCGDSLKKVKVKDVEVDQCPSCSGIWFDRGELESILSAQDISALRNRIENNDGHDAVEAVCPVCGGEGKMVPVKNSEHGLHIDTCITCCGHWLDGGELEKLHENSLLDALVSMIRLDADLLG